MAAQIFTDGNFQAVGTDGLVVPNGKLYVYNYFSGLLSSTYQDSAATIPNTNPIITSMSGKAKVFIPLGTYNIVLKTSNDVVVWTLNNFISTAFDSTSIYDAAQGLAIDMSRAEAAAQQAEQSAIVASAYANINWGGFTVTDGDLIVSYANGATSIPSLVDGEFIITY
jgi:hypothetical protein